MKDMRQDGFTFSIEIPIRKGPKRTKSQIDPFGDLHVDGEYENKESRCQSPVRGACRTTNSFCLDIRIKVALVCVLCVLSLMWNERTLGRYDVSIPSATSRIITTTSNATDDVSIAKLETSDARLMTIQSVPPTPSPSSAKSSVRPPTMIRNQAALNFRNSSTTENGRSSSRVHVIQWSNWTDLERIVTSIWNGNLFCTTIDEAVKKYYENNKISITVETKTTNPATNMTSTVPVVKKVTPRDLPIPIVHFGIELSCHDLYIHSSEGTGNYIEAIYMMRLAVQYITYANIQLNITCSDNTVEFQTDYVVPWFTGVWRSPNYFVNSTNGNNVPIEFQGDTSSKNPSEVASLPAPLRKKEYCGSFAETATGIMYTQIKYDVRRMAIALTCNSIILQSRQKERVKPYPHRGKVLMFLKRNIYNFSPNKSEQSVATNKAIPPSSPRKFSSIYSGNQQERLTTQTHVKPLIQLPQGDPPIDFDDAVIHFRCGDLLSTTLESYGFLTFDGYSRHISKATTRSIGILTQPFGNTTASSTFMTAQARSLDTADRQQVERCRILVHAFKDYLQEQFPNVTISIRNSKSETIALAYARMVMAKQVIGCMSTFSIFPVLGTFGTGYYLRPKLYDPSMWLTHRMYPVTKFVDPTNSFVLFDDTNVLLGPQTKDLWDKYGDDAVLKWFRTGKYTK